MLVVDHLASENNLQYCIASTLLFFSFFHTMQRKKRKLSVELNVKTDVMRQRNSSVKLSNIVHTAHLLYHQLRIKYTGSGHALAGNVWLSYVSEI